MYVKVPTGIKGVVARAGDRPFRLVTEATKHTTI